MTLIHSLVETPTPRVEIEALLNRHGPARVIRALVLALIVRPRRMPDVHALPDHLRRDIGLEVHPPSPRAPELMR